MRILMLTQFYPPVIGGEERHVITLSEALAARDHRVTVATLQHPHRADVAEDRGVTVRGIRGTMQRAAGLFTDSERPHAPPFPDPELVYELGRLISAVKPDVVHAHNWLSRSFLPLKRLSRASYVVTLHDYSLVCAKKNLMRDGAVCSGPALRKCLPCASAHYGRVTGPVTALGNMACSGYERRMADRFIAVSNAVAAKCRLPEGRVPFDVVPTFISDDVGVLKPTDQERLGQLPLDGYVLFVGDLTGGKGIHVLLKAYAQLESAPPLVMIGRKCPDFPGELPSNVTVFESWPHAAVMHAWSRCLFGLAPSVWAEACGTIVMEANAVGKAMIASDIGGLSDLVVSGETGLLVPPADPDALAGAMRELIVDPERRERMGAASLRHVRRFMSASIIPRIEAIYGDLRCDRVRDAGISPPRPDLAEARNSA